MSRIFRSTNRLGRLIGLMLVVAVLWKELRLPSDQRTWSGKLGGLIPYEFRVPSLDRVKASWWNPDDTRVFTPMVWGIGWSINLGRLARRFGWA